MADKLQSPLIEGLTEGLRGKEYPVLNGVDQYLTIPAFNGVSALAPVIRVDTDNDDGFVIDPALPITEIGRVGANYHSQNIRSVYIGEPSPLQGASFMPGNGVDRYAAMPEVTLAGDFEIGFWCTVPSVNNRLIGDTNETNTRIFLNPTNVAIIDSSGTAYTWAHGVPIGGHLKVLINNTGGAYEVFVNEVSKGIKIIPAADFTINSLLGGLAGYADAGESFANMAIRDLTNNNTYTYTNRNDSGNVLLNSGNTGSAFDGIWHEGASPMTDAAADAARTRLPMISRHYLMDTPGVIREVLGGGADATLINLDASDWQPEQ